MALSEREQRLLEEMERNLYNNEADVVTTLGVSRNLNYRSRISSLDYYDIYNGWHW